MAGRHPRDHDAVREGPVGRRRRALPRDRRAAAVRAAPASSRSARSARAARCPSTRRRRCCASAGRRRRAAPRSWPAIAAITTAEAVAPRASWPSRRAATGSWCCRPYVYRGDWRETRTHFEAVIGETDLPCMLYNNPVAYGTDVLPDAARRARRGAPEPRRGEGVEHGRAPGDGDPRALRRSAVRARRRRRRDRRGCRGGRGRLDRRPRRRAAGGVGAPVRARPRRRDTKRRAPSTSGSCPCCGSTRCRSSSS